MIRYGLLLLLGYAAVAIDALAPTWHWPALAPRTTTLLMACIACHATPVTAIPSAVLLGLASSGTSPVPPGWNVMLFVGAAFLISKTADDFFQSTTWKTLYATFVISSLLAAGTLAKMTLSHPEGNVMSLCRLLGGQIGATVGCGAVLAILIAAVSSFPTHRRSSTSRAQAWNAV